MPTTPNGRGLGRQADLLDIRDLRFAPPQRRVPLPPKVDLRGGMPPIGDQGQLGSCTAWATLAAYRWKLICQKDPDVDGSELAQYYWSRADDMKHVDSGATIREAIKTVAKRGMAMEADWPYDIEKFYVPPPPDVSRKALTHQALQYRRCPVDLYAMRQAISGGDGIVVGVSLYSSFESPEVEKYGAVPLPRMDEQMIGGHAMFACGYDDVLQVFIVRNSWSTAFGDGGYVYMPYMYLGNPQLGSDYWVLTLVEA